MSKTRLLATFFALLTAGCVTPPSDPIPPTKSETERLAEFDQKLLTWHGQDINALIEKRGAPTSTYKMPNGNIMYTFDNNIVAPGLFGGVPVVFLCTINFVVDQYFNRIVSHSFTGC